MPGIVLSVFTLPHSTFTTTLGDGYYYVRFSNRKQRLRCFIRIVQMLHY